MKWSIWSTIVETYWGESADMLPVQLRLSVFEIFNGVSQSLICGVLGRVGPDVDVDAPGGLVFGDLDIS